jgi:6,7-dimethyl-8-ribityllumazine synthase
MATEKIYPFMTKHCSKGEIFSFWVVVSEWNDTITEGLYNGAHEAFFENEVPAEHIIRWNVPGSFELVYGCKKMLQTQNVDAVIAIGCVFKGKPSILILFAKVTQGIKDLNVQSDIQLFFVFLRTIQCNNPLTEVEEFMVIKAQKLLLLLLKWLLVSISLTHQNLMDLCCLQVLCNLKISFRTKGIKLKTNYIFSIVKKTYPFILGRFFLLRD